MKLLYTLTFISLLSTNLMAQQNHIAQSTPFENVIVSVNADSVELFMNTYSKGIIAGEDDIKIWQDRLNTGKERLKKRFGDFQLSDFTFDFDQEESKLIIYFKGEEQMRIGVVEEDGVWKLDEK